MLQSPFLLIANRPMPPLFLPEGPSSHQTSDSRTPCALPLAVPRMIGGEASFSGCVSHTPPAAPPFFLALQRLIFQFRRFPLAPLPPLLPTPSTISATAGVNGLPAPLQRLHSGALLMMARSRVRPRFRYWILPFLAAPDWTGSAPR